MLLRKSSRTDILRHCRSGSKPEAHRHADIMAAKTGQASFDDIYWKFLLFEAPELFESYLIYMEKNRDPAKRFYEPRMRTLHVLVNELQNLEDNKYDFLGVSLPPRVGKLISDDRALKHSADDLDGDDNGQMDDQDNEIIKIDFDKITSKAEYLVCVLNSYRHQNFGIIPGIECRIYTNNSGRENDVDEVLASYKIDNNEDYEGNEAIILAHFYRHNDLWKFAVDSIGSSEKSISEISKGTALKVID